MSSRNFVTGLGMGIVAGSALGMLIAPRQKKIPGKSMVGRCLRNMGEVIDDVSDAFGK